MILGLVVLGVAVAGQIVPTPRATALPATATNRPFLDAASAREPVNLAARGYVEEEYLVNGNANIYDWSPGASSGSVVVLTPHVPYATRLLLRRPIDAKKFSGRVIVELLSATAGYDRAPLWGLSFDHFLRQGDVWAGLTVTPAAARTLQKFDPVRYASITFAFEQPPRCQSAVAAAAAAHSEDGLAWDIVAQVGALLRSSSKENPLAALNIRRLIAAGYAQTGGYIVTYSNALHAGLRLGDGRPVYDAYLDAAGAMQPAPINQCAAPLPAEDPRRRIGPRDVPVVTVVTQTELTGAPALRASDSDEPADVRRLYEIAGAAQSGPYPAGLPTAADLAIAGIGGLAAEDACREAQSSFPLGLAFNAIWLQLDDYLVRALPMQHAPPLDVDSNGNATGGLRLPPITVPAVVYAGRGTPKNNAPDSQQLCGPAGSTRRFDSSELKALYGTRAEYLRRYNAAVDQAVAERWLLPADAAAIKLQAARTPMSF